MTTLTKIKKNVGISELRSQLSKYFHSAKKEPIIVSIDRGRDTRVILDSELYNELIEAHEDQQDAKCLTDFKKEEGKGEKVLWQKIKNK